MSDPKVTFAGTGCFFDMAVQQKYCYPIFLLTAMLAFSGCSATFVIQAQPDASCAFQFNMNLGNVLAETVKAASTSMGMLNGGTSGAESGLVLFSAEEIESALRARSFTAVHAAVPSATELSAKAIIPAESPEMASFLKCTAHDLLVTLSPQSIRQLVATLGENDQSYMDLFMAPVLTGEHMTAEEYTDTLAAVYGTELAAELSKAQLSITMYAPTGKAVIKTDSTGFAQKPQILKAGAIFVFPLVEFLTLSETKTLSISW